MAHVLRLRGPLAADPAAQMFHIFLVVVGIWMMVSVISTLPLAPVTFRRLRVAAPMNIGVIGALVVIRLGYYRAASLIYLASVWIQATVSTSSLGGIRSGSLIFYGTLPVSAAWLLGYHAALGTAGVCIFSMLVFAVLEMTGMAPRYTPHGTPLGLWFAAGTATLVGTIPVGHVIRRLLDTLKELQGYKQHLELLVDQRTTELVKARDEAQAASRAKSAFLATVSHELRSPLNTIILLSDPACIGADTPDACRHDLHLIQRSGMHLLHLINDVLDSARIEAGQIVVENAPFDLRELIREVRDLMYVRAEEKSLDLLVEEKPGWPRFVQADRAKLRHILINLIDNAIKYTDRGKVTLRGDAGQADSTNRVQLRFEIEDTGIGIAPQDQARIFEPFTRLGNMAARKGTGLA
jgi:signal transduction histidine kinase